MSPAKAAVKHESLGLKPDEMVNAERTKGVCHDIWSRARLADSTTGGVAMKTQAQKIFPRRAWRGSKSRIDPGKINRTLPQFAREARIARHAGGAGGARWSGYLAQPLRAQIVAALDMCPRRPL